MQVSDLEKRNRRLTEVFQKQVGAVREACFRLFGYRLDMTTQPGGSISTIVLKPQHASRCVCVCVCTTECRALKGSGWAEGWRGRVARC